MYSHDLQIDSQLTFLSLHAAKLNTEEAQQLAARFNIRSIPTLALFVNGREVARQAGAFRSAQDIAQWVRTHL